MPRTVLDIGFDGRSAFNTAATNIGVRTSGAALTSHGDQSVAMAASSRVRLDRDPLLDELDTFTVQAEIAPNRFGRNQTVLESQTPPLRLTIDRSGRLKGALHTVDGWQEVTSSETLTKDELASVRLIRDADMLRLEVDGKIVGEQELAGAVEATGRAGMSIGTDVSGGNGFEGTLAGIRVIDGVVTAKTARALTAKAKRLRDQLFERYHVDVQVVLEPAQVDARFNEIKAIMRAAGIDDLAKLSTLRITSRTILRPGTILRAADATGGASIDWGSLATEFATATRRDPGAAARILDSKLVNRSVTTDRARELHAGGLAVTGRITPSFRSEVVEAPSNRFTSALGARERNRSARTVTNVADTLTARETLGPTLRRSAADAFAGMIDNVSAVEGVERLQRTQPGAWPVLSVAPLLLTSNVLPIDTAAIFARRLDLTNQTLEIDPSVGTLYIIVEEFEAANGARITWKRPVLDVPNIGPDANLNGHPSWSGVHTSGSKHGLPGGDAGHGRPGLPGRSGYDAPNVEIWALRANGMPDIDLEGQPGGRGGRGQLGGRGGRGADGEPGKWYWAFGKRCWENPGNGGNGGRGGNGGGGGRSGDGGDGGNILFAVLDETLAALTSTNAFSPDLGAGPAGPGGEGGPRGEGGFGGRRGHTEVCSGGVAGAQGQPGQAGPAGAGATAGAAGQMRIMTITKEAWDEQLTRPWLYDITPNAALPGSTAILKGSRFADTDQVRIGARTLTWTLRADEALDVTLPTDLDGGQHQIHVRRHDGQESNRIPIVVKPQVTGTLPEVMTEVEARVTGRAFAVGATVDYDGDLYPAVVDSRTSLRFTVPAAASALSAEHEVSMTVVNPDGQRSNTVTATVPQVLKNGFRLGVHDFSFVNDADGRPSWSTFEQTFGAVEVWHELLDPVFGHPILTAGFYAFYEHFLDGTANGGLATGFCTSLASEALDRFWSGRNDTFASVTRDLAFRRHLTAIHGRLLTRESLISFHDQGRRGQANVVTTFDRIEQVFRDGGTRETAPMLFFVPSGAAWDGGYFDKLADSHCIVPIRITYPTGHDGSNLDGVRMHCWDNNHPADPTCVVELRVVGGETRFTYTIQGTTKFASEDGITLATATLGEYLLRDHDLPFGGPLGLTRFVLDFLLSPATMSVVDDAGRVTGQVGGQILAEIPDSHPLYLVPNGYLLPTGSGLSRRITGTADGTYTYGSLAPEGTSLGLSDVPTHAGEIDHVLANADNTRVRFIPGAPKTVDLTIGRQISGHARGISIDRFDAAPTTELDVTLTPDLSLVRIANTGPDTAVDVKLLDFTLADSKRRSLERPAVQLPTDHDLVVAVTNWPELNDGAVTTAVVSH